MAGEQGVVVDAGDGDGEARPDGETPRQLVGGHKHPSTIVDAWALQEWAEQHGVKRSSEIEYERLTTAT